MDKGKGRGEEGEMGEGKSGEKKRGAKKGEREKGKKRKSRLSDGSDGKSGAHYCASRMRLWALLRAL